MSRKGNEALVRQIFDAFARKQGFSLRDCFAEDAVWQVPGANVMAGTYAGRTEIFRFLGNLTVSGVATITGATCRGSGSTILLGATALSNLYLDAGRTLRNEGTLTQTIGTVHPACEELAFAPCGILFLASCLFRPGR